MPRRTYDEDADDRERALTEAVQRLSDEVHTLRQAIDDLREELTWEVRQLREGAAEPKARFQLTSMPVDPSLTDFHQRVNAIDSSVFTTSEATLQELMQRLTPEVDTLPLTAEDWDEDQTFTAGEVVAIDSNILNWFTEHLAIVKRTAGWILVDDGEGWFYLLWSCAERCYLRLLTDAEQQEVSRLLGIELGVSSDSAVASMRNSAAASNSQPESQHTLW